MSVLFLVTSIGFFLLTIRAILFWVGLWQIKEYRFDRLRVHIKETIQGRAILFSPYYIFSLLFLFAYGFVVFNDTSVVIYEIVVCLFFISYGFRFFYEILFTNVKRPAITLKAICISAIALLFVVAGYIFPLTNPYVWLLVLNILLPLWIWVVVFTFSFPTEIYKDILITKARNKLEKNKNIVIVGVSGSYGKSSTKEYIAHVLSEKLQVVKTPLSNNTPIGIAKTILQKVTSSTQVLIVEIGAYKKGEIAEICSFVRPTISVTTALGDQHVSLYGSTQNIIESEKELLQALPSKGIALFNANNENMRILFNKYKKEKILYGTESISGKFALTISAQNIKVTHDGISFKVTMQNQNYSFHTQLLGVHNIENILPAIYLGNYFGLSHGQIIRGVNSLIPLSKTMKKFTSQNGVVFVDDTFNASLESVFSAANYIDMYPKKKIFVLMPLIELGSKAKQYHFSIGEKLAKFDYVFLTNKNFINQIKEGINSVDGKCKIIVGNADKIADSITQVAKKGDIVLFEGKEAGTVLNKLV